MKIDCQLTGNDRRELVRNISEIIRQNASYLYMSTYAYSIGELSTQLNMVHLHGTAIVQQAQANAQLYQQNQ